MSLENLFAAWREFRRGKGGKSDVLEFERNLEDHIFDVHERLSDETYRHGSYASFYVRDPKMRHIHKTSALDRLVHHAIVRVIGPIFDKGFIFDSWSCRKEKGTHRAIERFQRKAWRLSRNNTRTLWVLKCDIRRYFDSIHHETLLAFLSKKIDDSRVVALLRTIIRSFELAPGVGIPLGNLTSQLFANVYLDVLDQFIKHELRARHYLRYCDDFILVDPTEEVLRFQLERIREFLEIRLSLRLHDRKVSLTRYHLGIDVLGNVCFPYHRLLRTKTKRRMLKRLTAENASSYLGLTSHVRSWGIHDEMCEGMAMRKSREKKTVPLCV